MKMSYKRLAIDQQADLIFGQCPHPLTLKNGMVIGGGTVYPELNFTLPTLAVEESTWPKVVAHYREIASGALARAAELQAPGVVLEFETVPPMTANPDWGIELCELLLAEIESARVKYGLRAALRMTPNDNREMERPPVMRSGPYWEAMVETFERSAAAGADLLSIESVGGKEVHDEALIMADIRAVIFALCVMGVRDMKFLWDRIVDIARRHGVVAAGDTACGFGNTAMVLAEQRLIPHVFAAIVRPITAVRSLVAYECGALGPGKDCGYENPILKAITGFPMSMEGKGATCAHLSPLGNIAAATCDLWSNESVQNLKLLGGMAPTCCLEQLEYDCRLFNRAAGEGDESRRTLQRWLVESDAGLDPQAFVLTPANCLAFAGEIVASANHYEAGRRVAAKAVALLRRGVADDEVRISERDLVFLDLVEGVLETLPEDEETFVAETLPLLDTTKFKPEEYELG